MANPWFRFKQFTIYQDRCAMKVGTDGVLLGALAEIPPPLPPAAEGRAIRAAIRQEGAPVGNKLPSAGRILDIGTGTGLLALMLAQRSVYSGGVQIDAVEIDAAAAQQAAENVRNSPWHDRVRVIHQDFREFYPSCENRYDLIVSNPPYFRNSLRPAAQERDLARHVNNQFHRDLLKGSAHLLRPFGKCCLILPPDLAGELELMGRDFGLYVRNRISVYSKPGEKVMRQLITLEREWPEMTRGERQPELTEVSQTFREPPLEKLFIIHDADGSYTDRFRQLLQPFYLKF